MKNHEIVTAAVEFSQRARAEQIAFACALLDECRWLQRRLEQQKLVSTVALAGYVWCDGALEQTSKPPRDLALLLNELTLRLRNLSRIENELGEVAALIGQDKIAYGSEL